MMAGRAAGHTAHWGSGAVRQRGQLVTLHYSQKAERDEFWCLVPPSCFDSMDGCTHGVSVCVVPAEVRAALSTFRVSFLTSTPSTVSVRPTMPRCGPAVAHHILQRTRADVLRY